MSVVDLFDGAGGWQLAAAALGLDVLGVELDEDAHATATTAGFRSWRADVADIDPSCWPLDGLIASPPCQAWSKAGKRLGIEDQPLVFECLDRLAAGDDARAELGARCRDERSLLVVEPLRWALACSPTWVALEQVPDVLPCWERIAEILRARGYHAWTGVLNAASYGVPQTRQRAILIASRAHPVGPPAPSHSDQRRGGCLLGLAPWVSMADALGWGMTAEPVRTVCGGSTTPRWAAGAGANSYDIGTTLEGERDAGRWQLKERQANGTIRDADEPAMTITASADNGNYRWFVRTGANSMKHSRDAADIVPYERSIDEPAPTLDAKVGGAWKFVSADETGEGRPKDPQTQPADTITGKGTAYWTRERPATTVQGDPRVGRPGHKERENGEAQFAEGAVRVTLEEASVLQDFPADYPWQGTKTSRFRQVGNAIPPGLALAVLREAVGEHPDS